MKSRIFKNQSNNEYYFEEGCYINELANSEDDQEVSVAQARLEKGWQTKWHVLDSVNERYVIIQGQGQVETGDLPAQSVQPGDVVKIPAGVKQRIKNTGDGDLIFLAVCSPRFTPDCYHSLEE